VQVSQMDRNDRTIRTYTLYDAWPTTLDAIDLAFDTNDTLEEFTVTFRFNYMTASGGGVSSSGRTSSALAEGGSLGTS